MNQNKIEIKWAFVFYCRLFALDAYGKVDRTSQQPQ